MMTFEPEGIRSAIVQILEDNRSRDDGVPIKEILCWTANIIGFVPRMDNLIDATELEFTIKEQLFSLTSSGKVEWMANRHYRLY